MDTSKQNSQVQTPKSETVKVESVKVESKKQSFVCENQLKSYEECLQTWYRFSCATEQTAFKSCPQFDQWVENTVKKNMNPLK